MKKINRRNNVANFLFYISTIVSLTTFLIIYLTVKNECKKNEAILSNLNNSKIYNTNIVKELQSKREFLLSENNIVNNLSNKMIAVAPETLLIHINLDQ